jgi:hypothetical protein
MDNFTLLGGSLRKALIGSTRYQIRSIPNGRFSRFILNARSTTVDILGRTGVPF